MTHAFIYDALRTPRGRGKAGGGLYEVKPIDLLSNVMEALRLRNDLDTGAVEDLIVATGEPVGEQGQNIAKTAITYCGWDQRVCGAQIHRYCAGGLDAVNLAASKVMSGMEQLVVAGGVESMSRIGIGQGGAAQGDPWVSFKTYGISQGLAADIVANLEGFSREQLDNYALLSQQRAAKAISQGWLKSIVPVKDFNGIPILAVDELPRPTTAETLAKLQPAFKLFNDYGHGDVARLRYPQLQSIDNRHTAGSSSGVVDGASLVMVGNEAIGSQLGLSPRARIISFALTGTEPTIMLNGPVPATQKALLKAGLELDDIDLFEVNEAFSAVVLRYQKLLNIPDEKINVNGGAIAYGHPIGATGAMLVGTLLDELERRDLKRGLVSLCAGGGIGIATIIERL
ncbi:acetyl-CoA C-acetyltransferase [Gammaproteobacteria bacterium LSUCC0057]|uniref:Acetyl-CoA C-acetyltransferase n=1 Tax=Gammaproteobacteria bacterium LSUCC0057 TaxID=2559237 RepID=A0A4Y8UJ94_9GAMM|nr:acetyl-CoA C-acetyltransferase [Gammaproteobacteria bacterium LSUCC0057]